MSIPTVTGFFPKPQVIASLPDISLKQLQSTISGEDSLARRHNAFTDYCLGLLFCCTGHRAVNEPFSELNHFDLDLGLLVICDKVSDESRAWRMVALPDMAVNQVNVYRRYLHLLASKLQKRSASEEFPAQVWDLSQGGNRIPLFFYLQESGDGWDRVTPSVLSKRWSDRWRLPVSFLRHVMADTLLHLTQRADWVSIQLGHTDGVDHPFGSTSTSTVREVLGDIRPFLEEGLKKIGWVVAQSPLEGSRITYRPERASKVANRSHALFGPKKRKAERLVRHSTAAMFFRNILSQHFTTGFVLNASATQALIDKILTEAPSKSVNRYLTLLYRYLRSRPEGAAVLRQIYRLRLIEIEPSPFHELSLVEYQATQDARRAFIDYLHNQQINRAPFEPNLRLAEITVSAALFGGIADANRLEILGDALLRHSYRLKEHLFVDVPLRHGAVFRWFPDDLSKKLIFGLFRSARLHERSGSAKLTKFLNRVICEIGGDPGKHPHYWLAKLSKNAAVMEMPGYISTCLSGDVPAVSLPLPQWVRVVTGNALIPDGEFSAKTGYQTEAWIPPIDTLRRRQHTTGEGRAFLRELRMLISSARNVDRAGNQLLRTRSKRELLRLLQQACSDKNWSALPLMIAVWTIHLCQHGTRNKRDLAFSTIEKYAVLVSSRLLPVSVNIDVDALDEGRFEELYLKAIELEKPDRRFELASRLREMHLFFRDAYSYEDLDWSAIMGASGGRTEGAFADANVVTTGEYRRALAAILDEPGLEERRRWQYAVLLILGFRFGLRFGEAWRLRFTDVQREGTQMHIWVHHSVFGETKSTAGVRMLPLIEYLDQDESRTLDHLLAVCEEDFRDNPNAMLMAERSGEKELLDRAVAGRVLNALLRRVTGDNNIRFHHLRHGWVTRAVSTLAGLRLQAFNERPSDDAWSEFFGDDMGFPLRSIVVGAGHAHESTTLASYTHCVDQLALNYLPNPELTNHAQAYSEQVAYATIRTRNREGRTDHGRPPRIPEPDIPTTRAQQNVLITDLISRAAAADQLQSLVDVDLLLRRYRDSNQPLSIVAAGLNMDLQVASDVIARATDIEIGSGYDGYRLAERLNDPVANTVNRKKFRQFSRETAGLKNVFIRMDQRLQRLMPAERTRVVNSLQAWVKTAAEGKYCDLTREEELTSIIFLSEFIGIEIKALLSPGADTQSLRELIQSHGLRDVVLRKVRSSSIRVELTSTNGRVRSLLRLLLVTTTALTAKQKVGPAEGSRQFL